MSGLSEAVGTFVASRFGGAFLSGGLRQRGAQSAHVLFFGPSLLRLSPVFSGLAMLLCKSFCYLEVLFNLISCLFAICSYVSLSKTKSCYNKF